MTGPEIPGTGTGPGTSGPVPGSFNPGPVDPPKEGTVAVERGSAFRLKILVYAAGNKLCVGSARHKSEPPCPMEPALWT